MYQDCVRAGHLAKRPVSAQANECVHRSGTNGKGQSGDGVETHIRAELREFVVMNYLFGDITKLPGDDDSLVEMGIIDSTGILEIIEFLESHFDIEVSESETVPQNLGSISGLTRFVMRKQSVHEPAR